MNLYENNVSSFRHVFPHEVPWLQDQDSPEVRLNYNAANSSWTFQDSQGVFPHGSIQGLHVITPDKRFCVLYGLGDGEFLNRLREVGHLQHILVFEPSVQLVNDVMSQVDMRDCIHDERVSFIVGSDTNSYIRRVEGYFLKNIQRFCFSSNIANLIVPGAEKISAYKDLFLKFAQSFKGAVNNIAIQSGFYTEDSFFGLTNSVNNYSHYNSYPQITDFKDVFKKTPGVVVGPGPSLPKSFSYLREIQDRVLIVACDSAVKLLFKEGINPQIVCCLERYGNTSELFQIPDDADSVMVTPSVVSPQTLLQFKNEKISIGRTTGYDEWLYPHLNRFFLGQTVSQLGMRILEILGCPEIYLLGIDCAYDPTTGKSHHQGVDGFIEKSNDWIKEEGAFQIIDVTGYDGKPKQTYITWLTDTYIISEMVLESQLNVKRVTPKEYSLPIENTERVDPESLDKLKNLPKIDVYKTLVGDRESFSKNHKQSGQVLKQTIEPLSELKLQCLDLLNTMNASLFERSPEFEENHDYWKVFLKQADDFFYEMPLFFDGVYLKCLHNILQGHFALTGFQITKADVETKDKVLNIKEKTMLYQKWFMEVVSWTERTMHLLREK